MTLKEFEALMKEEPILHQKFKAAKEAVTEEDVKDKSIALSEIIQNLGYDVPADEIALTLIATQSFDENELEAVAGGEPYFCYEEEAAKYRDIERKQEEKKRYIKETIRHTNQCKYDFTDTDCLFHDFCDYGAIKYGWNQV